MRIPLLALLTIALHWPGGAAAQSDWFPDRRAFAGPIADPLEPRIAGGMVLSDLFEVRAESPAERPPFDLGESVDDLETDIQATVALGGTMPLWATPFGADGEVVIAPQLAVFARFRLEPPSRDEAGTDWVVALPVEVRLDDRVAGRLRVVHRSAHLGDEVLQSGGALRLEFSYEAVDALVGVTPLPGLRLYGGGALIFRSQTFRWASTVEGTAVPVVDFDDDYSVQAGIEAEGGGVWGWRVAADWQAAQRGDWDSQVAAIAGVTRRVKGRRIALHARLQAGKSHLGEFFLTDERLLGVEIEFQPWR